MPVERWSTTQVLAVAPDASSAKGARGVSGSGKWAETGLDGEILWGSCRGSGQKPYQVCVDLAEPAYRCSCPSRKFPCKHVLGLLLLWASGHDGADATPPWVIEWRDRRMARAKTRAEPGRDAGPPADPAAARRRAEQRTGRIADGLVELDRWLGDQVRQGLATAEHAGHRPYEAMAARLVDAQAPTAASAVRRLGRVAGVGPNWADRLLGELALLRLLVAGHARLAELPEDLAATVRSRIGFPVSTDEVLATPPVRDRWTVLGQVDEVGEKLTSRRTWLRGAETGRFALLLAYAAPGQALPADAVPGTLLDAELCFYPAVSPLRALVARRHPPVGPAPGPTSGGTVAGALADWGAALAADPWCVSVPVLLADVTPSADGHLVDAAGDGLPLRSGHQQPWWLLAAAGGHPVTVAAEYGTDGLRPLAAWVDGRYVAAEPGQPGGPVGRPPELPPALLSAALAGTDRQPWPGGAVPVQGRDIAVGAQPTPAGLLEAAAAALTYRRAGVTPTPDRGRLVPAAGETQRPVPPAAARRLALLLSDGGMPGGQQVQQVVLGQWLRLAAGYGFLVPPEELPRLLDAGRRSTAIRPALAVVAGERGRWLAALNPDWRYLLGAAGTADPSAPDDVWSTGTPGQRLAHLRRLRREDPATGLRLLREAFVAEAPTDRAAFLGALAVGLSSADEELIESALGDRRKEVREAAVDLLQALPGSALRQRMAQRALACVRLERRALGGDRLSIDLPPGADAATIRDGVDPKAPRGVGEGAWLLEQIVAATPLETWTGAFDRKPAAVVALPVPGGGQYAWHRGLARAAIAARDPGWAVALADPKLHRTGPDAGDEQLTWRVYEVLPPDELSRQAGAALRRDPSRAHRLLEMYPAEWPEVLGEAVIDAIRALVAAGSPRDWQLTELCRIAATALPPRHADRIARLAEELAGDDPTTTRRALALSRLAAGLSFRHEMHREFG